MRTNIYKGILADLDGTVNRGNLLIPGADVAYRDLSIKGVQWIFTSNSATRLACDLAKKINRLGLVVSTEQVINSASAVIEIIQKEYMGVPVMVVGESPLAKGIEGAGAVLTDDPESASIVTVALDTGFTYDKLKRAHRAITNGALFWATNLDPTFPTEQGFLPGAGSIVTSVATAAGREPDKVFGKPSSDMAIIALRLMNISSESCLVVGDRMDTDILFAINAGMDSALVLSGATSRDDLASYSYTPTYIFESILDIMKLF